MELIFGTGNHGKFMMMKDFLEELNVDLIGLDDLPGVEESPEESGSTPLENARMKAEYYYRIFQKPVFSCDSGFYIHGLPEEEQPGVHVRNVGGRRLSDEEMTAYYSDIAHRLGGKCLAEYRNAICLIMNSRERYEYEGADIGGGSFYLVDRQKSRRRKVFLWIVYPLILSQAIISWRANSCSALIHRKRDCSVFSGKPCRRLKRVYRAEGRRNEPEEEAKEREGCLPRDFILKMPI